jgi:hypothetical protein
MDLRKEILREHSKAQALKIVRYVGKSRSRFAMLVDVFLEGPYRVTQRAAWPLNICAEAHPPLIAPHLKKILALVKKPGVHDAVKRNTMRLLQFVDIPRALQGAVADLCFRYLQDKAEAVAVRVFAMTVLGKIAKTNPELKHELILLIEDGLPYGTAAFHSRAKKVMKELRYTGTSATKP